MLASGSEGKGKGYSKLQRMWLEIGLVWWGNKICLSFFVSLQSTMAGGGNLLLMIEWPDFVSHLHNTASCKETTSLKFIHNCTAGRLSLKMQILGYWAVAICFEPLNFLCCFNGHLQNLSAESCGNTVASFIWKKSIFAHPSPPLHSDMNVYSILLREDTNYGTWLSVSRLYSSSNWGYILLISASELGNSVIFLLLRNWATCFILLIVLFSLTSSVSMYQPPLICVKGANIYIVTRRCSKSCVLATISIAEENIEYIHPSTAILFIN